MENAPLFIILNPAAGKGAAGRVLPRLRQHLRTSGLRYELVLTRTAGEARQLAADAAAQPFRAVVAAGGDGTVNEVVNGVLGTAMPLGLIPLGTGNDAAKLWDLRPGDLDGAVHRLATGQPRRIDLGLVGERAFLNGLGVGFDAAVAIAANRPSRLRGLAVYVKALLTTFVSYRAPAMVVSFAGKRYHRRFLLVSVGNGRCQGGTFWLTPDARVDDGLFDLCLVDRLSRYEFVRHVPKVIWGKHTHLPQVTMGRASEVSIESSDPLPVHVDGELLGTDLHHLHVRLLPAALTVIA